MNAHANAIPIDHLQGWIGKSQQSRDIITGAPVAGLAAMLDRGEAPVPPAGTPIPPLGHWFFCLPHVTQSALGPDGLQKRDDFSPPVPLPRRMWAGGRIRYHHPLVVGDEAIQTTTIKAMQSKGGRNGALVFVTTQHEIANARGVAVTEEIDGVYREEARADAPAREPVMAPTDETFSRIVEMDVVKLFRYSALTFNGHRIHYDRPYATEVEGYPGLVVHGPLIATLLGDLFCQNFSQASLRSFEFKAMSPLFDTHTFEICGKQDSDGSVALWARAHDGALAMMCKAIVG
jgi:3-methylfumaryl-CoA hydratase